MDVVPDITGFELSKAIELCKTSGYKIEIMFTRPYKVQPEGKPRVIRFHRASKNKGVITVAFEEKRKEVDKVAYRITEECLACGACMDACPSDAISEGDIYKIDPDKCENCGACVDACPTGAIVEE
jgi:ferredoxin